jgi:hypothetical protein
VAGATPFPKVGWPDHPIFGQGVASATPYRPYGGGRSHPRPLGVVRPPQKAQKKKKIKGGNGFWPLGVAGPPPRAWGWLRTPPAGRRWWLRPPPCPRGWSGHPQRPKPIFSFFFFFLGPFGVARPPPKAWGGFGHPHTAGMGWPKPPLGQKWGGPATPLLGRGWLQPPRFPLFFFFFFFFFLISFFFSKKKKKKKKTKT